MVRFYRKGLPSAGCCWFKGEDGRDEALNYSDNGSNSISRVIVNLHEEKAYFMQKGIGYILSRNGFNCLEERIEIFDIEEFTNLCNSKYSRFA